MFEPFKFQLFIFYFKSICLLEKKPDFVFKNIFFMILMLILDLTKDQFYGSILVPVSPKECKFGSGSQEPEASDLTLERLF